MGRKNDLGEDGAVQGSCKRLLAGSPPSGKGWSRARGFLQDHHVEAAALKAKSLQGLLSARWRLKSPPKSSGKKRNESAISLQESSCEVQAFDGQQNSTKAVAFYALAKSRGFLGLARGFLRGAKQQFLSTRKLWAGKANPPQSLKLRHLRLPAVWQGRPTYLKVHGASSYGPPDSS